MCEDAIKELDQKLFALVEEFKDKLTPPGFCSSLFMVGLLIAEQTAPHPEDVKALWDRCYEEFTKIYRENHE
jgi:hypothetical protein